MGYSSKVKGQHLVWKAATLTKEDKNRSALWADLYVVFLAVMLKLNNDKIPRVLDLPTHGQWPTARPYGQAEGQWKPGLLKEKPHEAQPYANHYGHLRGALK